MDKIIDYTKQLYTSHELGIAAFGGIFIFIGIITVVFKEPGLIAGVNTMSEKELAKINLNSVTRFCGICFCILGLFMVLNPLIFDCLNVSQENRIKISPIVIVSFIVFMVLYLNVFKRKRFYKKDERN